MYLRDGKLVRTDIWREGAFLDLWSVPHFLSGISVSLGLYLLGFGFHIATVVAFFLLVAWEFFEYFASIEEGRLNSLMDVVVGMISFVPAFMWAASAPQAHVLFAFLGVTAFDGILSSFGWVASRKAHVLEQKLRTEYLERKKLLEERKALFRLMMRKRREVWRMRKRWWRSRGRSSDSSTPLTLD